MSMPLKKRRKLNIVTVRKPEFVHDNDRSGVKEDRISILPDELIHHILSFTDTKVAVQTSMLSSRWKLMWTSMPSLKFISNDFDTLPKFSKFVTHVLSRRNHQIEVSSVKLKFHGAASQVFVRKIANYAFSHNVQELTVSCWPKKDHEFPPCLFSSPTLKHFTFSVPFLHPCLTPKTPWDFPALTTLHLSDINLCDDNRKSLDLFSKCVNLTNLTLETFIVDRVEVFDIITPKLLNLKLIHGRQIKAINLVAPELENLTIIQCSIKHLNVPSRISSLCYKGYDPPQWFQDSFHSVNEVTLSLCYHTSSSAYTEEDARETINMLQELRSARYLTLSIDIIECISSFPDILFHHPSPFSDLILLNINSSTSKVSYRVNMITEARKFLLENSPSATFIMDLPEMPTKAMKAKEAREKNAKLVTEIESRMKELQASVNHGNTFIAERKQATEKTIVTHENLMAELQEWTNNKMTQSEEGKKPAGDRLGIQLATCLQETQVLTQQNYDDFTALESKKAQVRSLLENLPKRQMAVIEARYSRQLEETERVCVGLHSISQDVCNFLEKLTSCIKNMPVKTSAIQDVSGSKLPQVNTPSSSSITPVP